MELQSIVPGHQILLARNEVTVAGVSAPPPVTDNDDIADPPSADASRTAPDHGSLEAAGEVTPTAISLKPYGPGSDSAVIASQVAVLGGRPIESPKVGSRPGPEHHLLQASGTLRPWDAQPQGDANAHPASPPLRSSFQREQRASGSFPSIPKGYEGYDLGPPIITPRQEDSTSAAADEVTASRTSSFILDETDSTAMSDPLVLHTGAPQSEVAPCQPTVINLRESPQQLRSSTKPVKLDSHLFFVIGGMVRVTITLKDSATVPESNASSTGPTSYSESASMKPEVLQDFGFGSSFSSGVALRVLSQKYASWSKASDMGVGSYTQQLSASTTTVAEVLCISQTLYDMAVHAGGSQIDEDAVLLRYACSTHGLMPRLCRSGSGVWPVCKKIFIRSDVVSSLRLPACMLPCFS